MPEASDYENNYGCFELSESMFLEKWKELMNLEWFADLQLYGLWKHSTHDTPSGPAEK